MPETYKPIVTASLAKQIANSIREAIISGHLAVNERLPTEEELAERFGVSRATIREALKRLAAENLVRSRRGPAGGTFVNKPSQEDLRRTLTNASTLLVSLGEFSFNDIIDARGEFERVSCRHAALHRTDRQLERMRAELEIQREPRLSDEDFCASDVRFHHALVDVTPNAVLKFIMFSVIEALQPVTNMVVFRYRERQTIIGQHERIVAAIEARDADTAAAVVSEQVAYLRDKYRRASEEWQKRHPEKAPFFLGTT